MELNLKELEDKLQEMRGKGATDDSPVTFDGSNDEVDFERDIFPNIYYCALSSGAGFVVIDLS